VVEQLGRLRRVPLAQEAAGVTDLVLHGDAPCLVVLLRDPRTSPGPPPCGESVGACWNTTGVAGAGASCGAG